jgi:cytochrome oxidase assembly protein ShyY1
VELIENIKNTAADPPATLPASTNQRELHNKFEVMKGQRVRLTGRFDHSKGDARDNRDLPLIVPHD